MGPQGSASGGPRLPPGLSVIEEEFIQLISLYMPVTVHNPKSFAQFYLSVINEHLAGTGEPRPGPSKSA